MTIQRTQWASANCPCIIEYEWDDTTTEDNRIHTPVQSIKCSIHSGLPSHQQVYDSVLDESRKLSWGLQTILDNGPSTIYDIDPTNDVKRLKSIITPTWTLSGTPPNRTTTVSLSGISLTTAQKRTIQTALDNKFGTGKVTLL